MLWMFLASVLFVTAHAVRLPKNFDKCNRKQPDLDRCVFDAVQDAIPQLNRPYPDLNIPNLEPLFVEELSTNSRGKLVNMDEHLYNCTFYGFKQAHLKQFTWDLERKKIEIAALFPEIRSHCTFKIDGRIIVFPIHSSGPSRLKFTNFDAQYHIAYEEVAKGGKTYVNITSSRMEGKPSDIHFDLENVVPGNEFLTKLVNRAINASWRLLYDDIKETYFEMANEMLRKLFVGFFKAASIEELFD